MKKSISILITLALLLIVLFTLASCSHECTFSSEWSTDESAHWHVCTVEDCIECADKADHSWNDGEITTKPTRDAEGVMTYVCTVCEYKREEALPKCDFNGEWLKDDNFHWHVCQNEGCEEIGYKSEHNWNDGKITTEPTQQADGVKTYTCKQCKITKEESVEFIGLNKSEWDKLFDDKRLDNFTYTQEISFKIPGLEMETSATIKFTKDKALLSVELMGESIEEILTGTDASVEKAEMIDSIQSSFAYDSFEYDTKEKAYILKSGCTLGDIAESEYIDSAKLTIKEDGTIELIYIGTTVTDGGTEMDFLSTLTLSDFGTTKIVGSSSIDVSLL